MRDVINSMRDAASEIRLLRQQNALMAARLQGFDDALQLLNAAPPESRGHGVGIDAAWVMDREAEKLEKQLAEAAKKQPVVEE